jgi:CRP-like cAMP-binding protein
VHEATTDDTRDAAIVGAAQRMEHYELAAYACARTYARRLNRSDEARLLQETLNEESRADRRLTAIAEAHIAAGEEPAIDPPLVVTEASAALANTAPVGSDTSPVASDFRLRSI